MQPQPFDLSLEFGDRYRIEHDPAFDTLPPEEKRLQRRWLTLIACVHGSIGPFGEATLHASTNKAGAVARALKALPFAIPWMDGDDGLNVIFPASEFDAVAAIMKPRKRRKLELDEADRRAVGDRLRRGREKGAKNRSTIVPEAPVLHA